MPKPKRSTSVILLIIVAMILAWATWMFQRGDIDKETVEAVADAIKEVASDDGEETTE